MLLNVVYILLTVLFFAFLILGLVQCRKHSFTAGFYFFLILIVNKIAPYFYNSYIHNYVISLTDNNNRPPMGMSLGDVLAWFSFIPIIIDLIAFGILVIGLYNMWRSKIAAVN